MTTNPCGDPPVYTEEQLCFLHSFPKAKYRADIQDYIWQSYSPNPNKISVKFTKTSPSIKTPVKNGDYYELYPSINVTLKPFEFRVIDIGIILTEIEPGWRAKISGDFNLFANYGISLEGALVNNEESIKVILQNNNVIPYFISTLNSVMTKTSNPMTMLIGPKGQYRTDLNQVIAKLSFERIVEVNFIENNQDKEG